MTSYVAINIVHPPALINGLCGQDFPKKLWIEERSLGGWWVLGLAVEKLSDPIGQGVKAEVVDAEDALRGPQDMAGHRMRKLPTDASI